MQSPCCWDTGAKFWEAAQGRMLWSRTPDEMEYLSFSNFALWFRHATGRTTLTNKSYTGIWHSLHISLWHPAMPQKKLNSKQMALRGHIKLPRPPWKTVALQQTEATPVRLSGNAPFFPSSVCGMCGSCCCDQSQFNRHRLKVNLQGAMKADRWGLTAVSPTHIKDTATVEDEHFWKEQRDSERGEQDSSWDKGWPRGWIPKGHEY